MPLSSECKQRLIKQNPAKPTVRRGIKEIKEPGPNIYEVQPLCGGQGYSHYRRAPAYSFGLYIPVPRRKPTTAVKAPQISIRGHTRKGRDKIKLSVIGIKTRSLTKLAQPGPDIYFPPFNGTCKRPPAFTLVGKPKDAPTSKSEWTAPPNMYCPPMVNKPKYPVYSIQGPLTPLKPKTMPAPGSHNPNSNYGKKTKPLWSFGLRTKLVQPTTAFTPAPNAYCDLKFNVGRARAPVPSFGIRHSQYLGKSPAYLTSINHPSAD